MSAYPSIRDPPASYIYYHNASPREMNRMKVPENSKVWNNESYSNISLR